MGRGSFDGGQPLRAQTDTLPAPGARGDTGARDLGQEIFRALTLAVTGRGLVVGLCVAFMGLAADRLIGEWATRR
jgi:hypothetical protein